MRPLGLRTVVYQVTDLDHAKSWYAALLERTPYFDQPFYVGFNVGGYELGLHPAGESDQAPGPGGSIAYWGVPDLEAFFAAAAARGVTVHEAAHDVGEGIKVGTVRDPFGNLVGFIENPHFTLQDGPE